MKKSWITLGVVAAVIILIVSSVIGNYNSMVTAEEAVNKQWAQVETQYQRRFDLIPNLVSSVRGVLTQEQTVFSDIAEARTRYAGATSTNERAEAANEIESNLGRLLVIMENYPQLKSAETVQTLMSQLEGTENRVSVERGRYNEAVNSFNLNFRRIPQKWIASLLGFTEKEYFDAVESAQTAPTVDL